MEREKLGSRLGFILLSAGCAIGIGNVWKFPYMVGANGGGIFVLFYLFFLVAMGLPLMTMEFAIGRASRKSPVSSFKALEKPGQKWHLHGITCIIGNFLLMMFYTVVAGWMLHYCYIMVKGDFTGLDNSGINGVFDSMVGDPLTMAIWTAIVIVLGFAICSVGLKNGVERITKVLMIALLLLIVILAVNSCFLDGAGKGLSFYLVPKLETVKNVGIGTILVGAMNQAFFTLSIGIGSMAIFGSYIGKERALAGESIRIMALDTFVAVVSGFIIFPACMTYDVPVNSGPDLIFKALPQVFINMPGGRIWGSLFFLFLAFAAFTTVIAVFENIVSCVMELTGWKRIKSSVVNGILMLVLSMPCILGFNLLSSFKPFGAGNDKITNIMDLEDFLVSNIILPVGAIVYLLFCVSKKGWGFENYINEVNTGSGMKLGRWIRVYVTYVLPIVIFALLIVGIADKL